MKLTNKRGLPQALVKAAELILGRKRPAVGFSVTEIIDPPQLVQLQRRNPEMEVDVSEVLWLLLGSAMHTVIARAAMKDQERELRANVPIDLYNQVYEQLTGHFDLAEEGRIKDWKVTSVWSYLRAKREGKSEWEKQLNLYAYLARKTRAFEPEGLDIEAILRDWTAPEAARDPDYPQVPFATLNVSLWPFEEQEAYAVERMTKHVQAASLATDELPECSPEERWWKPPVWAVMKPSSKRAKKLYENEDEAKADLKAGETIVFRPASFPRCELYCNAGRAGLCRQANRMQDQGKT